MTRIALFAAAALMTAAAAHAQSPAQTVVKFSSLNLSQPQDLKLLDHRLQAAALEVCQAGDGSATVVVEETKRSDCYKQALSSARSTVLARTSGAAIRTASR